jgi:ketosteroid isomerase-like protein
MMQSAGTVLEAFYAAVRRKDIAAARQFLDPNLTFYGLFETYRDAEAYLSALTGLLSITTRLDVKTIVAQGDDAAVFFELETTAPAAATTLVAEWHQVRNGKIVEVRSAFDGRPFAAMFGSKP